MVFSYSLKMGSKMLGTMLRDGGDIILIGRWKNGKTGRRARIFLLISFWKFMFTWIKTPCEYSYIQIMKNLSFSWADKHKSFLENRRAFQFCTDICRKQSAISYFGNPMSMVQIYYRFFIQKFFWYEPWPYRGRINPLFSVAHHFIPLLTVINRESVNSQII